MTRNNNSPKKSDTVTNKYCILIPARNESQVIEQLLISIEKQTKKINSKDVYIIVESKEDPTVEIVKKHNMNIVYRKDLTKKRGNYIFVMTSSYTRQKDFNNVYYGTDGKHEVLCFSWSHALHIAYSWCILNTIQNTL